MSTTMQRAGAASPAPPPYVFERLMPDAFVLAIGLTALVAGPGGC